MSAGLSTVALAALVWLAFAGVGSILVSVVWTALAPRLGTLHPARRARITFAAAVAPTLLPTLFTALCLAPGIAAALGLHADHCVRHAGHPHLCVAHPRALPIGWAGVWLAAAGGLGGLAAIRTGRELAASARARSALRLAEAGALAPSVRVAASTRPFSLTAGLVAPEVWLSSGLVRQLDPRQLEVVLAHERAHVRRRDPALRLAASIGSLPLPARLRRSLLSAFLLASEQACDEEAARHVGDRLRVAETLLVVERALGQAPVPAPVGIASFGGSDVAPRVEALLGPDPGAVPAMGRAAFAVALLVALLAALAAVDPVHHGSEHVLGFVLRAH